MSRARTATTTSVDYQYFLLTDELSLTSLVGPLVFKAQEAPKYNTGWIATIVTSIVCVLTALVYRFVCAHENKRRDKTGQMEAYDHAYEDDKTCVSLLMRTPPSD